jgi:zinc resistance-associated protein
MWKAALAGALALATVGSSVVSAEEYTGDSGERVRPAAQAGLVLTSAHITRFKAVLKLTPAQEPYWPAVEAALRDLISQQKQEAASAGYLQRFSNRLGAAAVNAQSLRRVMAAAMPLIKTLDEGQKRDAMVMARALGVSHVAAAF